MLLDRTIAPDAQPITKINIPEVEVSQLANGLPIYLINTSTQPIVRFEAVFEAGNKFEAKTGLSYFTLKMLTEGTKNFTANEIAEKFASIGYFVEFSQGAERAVLSLNGLSKHLEKALVLLKDILTNAIFPTKELENLKTITKQNLLINLEKTAFVASQAFKENLFGSKHYIGKNMTETDIDLINIDDLKAFYQEFILNKQFKIFIAGKIEPTEMDCIARILGADVLEKSKEKVKQLSDEKYQGIFNLIEKEGALQSSLRIGKKLIERNHPDYFKFLVCNTILGGYFGSRLMKNIREDKGYTYGISSQFLPISQFAYFMIATDVKKEFTQNTITEIKKEIGILQTTLVDDEELNVVKNFVVGDFAGSFNTAFEIGDKFKVSVFESLPVDFYHTFIDNILKVTAIEVQEMAQKYLKYDEMLEIVVGGV
jgi:zinc protease